MEVASTTELQTLLEQFAVRHSVPGATVAVLDGNEITNAATGVISKNTGVDVTTDTLFQIGSITKLYTATLIMQLVDNGMIELDRPIRDYLPELKLADPEATDRVTIRHLLCHTGGLDEEVMKDTGRGDDCIEKYVTSCASIAQIGPPGRIFSYSNAGFVILGRLIENLSGQTWDRVLKERLLEPLGADHTVTLPEEAILHRTAVGHHRGTGSDEETPAKVWGWPRSIGPAGNIVSTAADVIHFAKFHLAGGISHNGSRVLSEESVWAMQEEQVESPNKWLAKACGLGWKVYDWNGRKVIGHDGGGLGQRAFLRIAPDVNFGVGLLTNGLSGVSLYKDLFKRLFAERVSIDMPQLPRRMEPARFDPSPYVGTYHAAAGAVQARIEAIDGCLFATIDYGSASRKLDEAAGVTRQPLRAIDEAAFLIDLPNREGDVFVFADFDRSGRPRYLHWGVAWPRTD